MSSWNPETGYDLSDPKGIALDLVRATIGAGTTMRCCVECGQLPWNCVCDDGPEFYKDAA